MSMGTENIQMKRNYQEFNTLPTWTTPVWTGDEDNRVLVNDHVDCKWSGLKPPPAIGAKVKTTMNNLGAGTVTGYFTEHGWLGVTVQLSKPPTWYTRQNNGNPPATLFGIDLDPPRKK